MATGGRDLCELCCGAAGGFKLELRTQAGRMSLEVASRTSSGGGVGGSEVLWGSQGREEGCRHWVCLQSSSSALCHS